MIAPREHTSLILTMHARYEETMLEYSAVEKAESAARKEEHTETAHFEQALRSLTQETDALRLAILHQVPDEWTEAMILQFHIVNAYDMHVSCDGPPPEGERDALHTAIDTIFDFMCCNVTHDPEQLGGSFREGGAIAYRQRRYRTGRLEGC